jgi:hypothetical protein
MLATGQKRRIHVCKYETLAGLRKGGEAHEVVPVNQPIVALAPAAPNQFRGVSGPG